MLYGSIALCLLVESAHALTLQVPLDYASIQEGIDASAQGDTVLVAPAVYVENVDFRGRNIVLASHFVISGDPEHILQTVIEGGQPEHADSASCVRLVSGEDSTAVLAGFTLTGGWGTRLYDNWQEGGGVMCFGSSPRILHNRIVGNHVGPNTEWPYEGGGGISASEGNPLVAWNVIQENSGNYGGGFVCNNGSARLHHNLVVNNRALGAYGGGGLLAYQCELELDHLTLCGNEATGFSGPEAGQGGALGALGSTLVLRNSILWNNRGVLGFHGVNLFQGSSLDLDWSLAEYEEGTETLLSSNPLFMEASLRLSPESLAVDAGLPLAADLEAEDPESPGMAAWPCQGTIAPDLGAWGGAQAAALPADTLRLLALPGSHSWGTVLPGAHEALLELRSLSSIIVTVDSLRLVHLQGQGLTLVDAPALLAPQSADTLHLAWQAEAGPDLVAELQVYHSDPQALNPLVCSLSGHVFTTGLSAPAEQVFELAAPWPNPFNGRSRLAFGLDRQGPVRLALYDLRGRLLRTLWQGPLAAGRHAFELEADDLASGTYLLHLETDSRTRTRRITLVR